MFFRLNGVVWTYSFVVLSGGSQDNAWVQHTFKLLLEKEIPAARAKMGLAPMTPVTFFTDNCGKKIKCQYNN